MNNYFSSCTTVEEIKALYRRLAMQHHPDRGGDVEAMKAVNSQYQAALKSQHGTNHTGTDNKQHTYYYKQDVEEGIMNKISELCGLRMDGVEIALIGTWVWVTGDTKPHRQAIKKLGCRWHARRACWYWHPPQKYRSRQSKGSLSELAQSYGCKFFDSDRDNDLVAA